MIAYDQTISCQTESKSESSGPVLNVTCDKYHAYDGYYQPRLEDNKALGDLVSLDQCKTIIKSHKFQWICVKEVKQRVDTDDSRFVIMNAANQTPFGPANYIGGSAASRTDLQTCIGIVAKSNKEFICAMRGESAGMRTVYRFTRIGVDDEPLEAGKTYGSLDECAKVD
ncbi:MAG: hypothetical protein AB7T49_11485 [Oligoflexales bacterium]